MPKCGRASHSLSISSGGCGEPSRPPDKRLALLTAHRLSLHPSLQWMGPRFAFKQPEGAEFSTKHLAWMTSKPYPWQLAGIGDAARGLVPRGDVASADSILASSEGGMGAAHDGFSGFRAAGNTGSEAHLAAGDQLSQAAALRREGAVDLPSTEHHCAAVGWSTTGLPGSGKHPHRLKPISGAHGARASEASPPLHSRYHANSRTPSPAVEGRLQRSYVSPATVLPAAPGSLSPLSEAGAPSVWGLSLIAPKATKAALETHSAARHAQNPINRKDT